MNKLKKVKFKDIIGIFIFLIVLFPSLIYKLYLKISKKELWLICESEHMARDNGYIFYKFLKENHKEIKSYYAINKKCNDYNKIKNLDGIIQWSSIKHYFYYMSATKNISSHKEGNPNQAIFTVLHLYLNLYNNRVFLQHGVLYQNLEMFHKKNTKFKIFICGAKPEYDFICQKYGYDNEVKYTGLARFDNLHNIIADPQKILYMPTWRRWIEKESDLKKSEYFQKIMSFINSKKIEDILKKYDKYLYFCSHGGLRNINNCFKSNNSRVKIIDIKEADVQKMLIENSLLITDYSSLHTDFAYMKKPIVYYQYDEQKFKEKHIGKKAYDTYYNYKKDGFGIVVEDEEELIENIEKIIKNNFKEEKLYEERVNNFFMLYDDKNCERIFKVISNEKSK